MPIPVDYAAVDFASSNKDRIFLQLTSRVFDFLASMYTSCTMHMYSTARKVRTIPSQPATTEVKLRLPQNPADMPKDLPVSQGHFGGLIQEHGLIRGHGLIR